MSGSVRIALERTSCLAAYLALRNPSALSFAFRAADIAGAMVTYQCWLAIALVLPGMLSAADATKPASDADTVAAEHADIGVTTSKKAAAVHTQNPDAQWYPDASFGLFIHWGIASVKAMNISWPMIPGRALAKQRIDDPAERARIIREGDWNLNGKPNEITPNEYWSMAKDFNPQSYDPDKWLKAAKAAGFTYAVLTTRHHEGFCALAERVRKFRYKEFHGRTRSR